MGYQNCYCDLFSCSPFVATFLRLVARQMQFLDSLFKKEEEETFTFFYFFSCRPLYGDTGL